MKTFIVCSDTNYGLMVHVVNTDTKEEAIKLATEDGAWDGCLVYEIATKTRGVVYKE
jgi:hypothetical protein